MSEREYWLAFSGFPAIGPARFKKILAEFGTAKKAWEATSPAMAELIGEETAGKFDSFKEEFSIENYIKKLKEEIKKNIKV